ncbi:MAG: molybdopterin molybdotransferase MoeA [Woeseiaceae bacterium]|nr:molybdopterin molybdotransferase MoeA [Woeseiaceae bacterium]
MFTTEEASKAIRDAVNALSTESVGFQQAVGRVLHQAVVAERDQPPFDRVMMDGIAIRYSEFAEGQRTFAVQSTQHAGDERQSLKPGHAIEIMTGASLPQDADCIIPVERIIVNDLGAHVRGDYEATERQFIHACGSDHTKGTELLARGKRVTAADIAVIASAGLSEVDVAANPTIRVISTGNELVPPGEPIADHQIRMSNGPAVVALLTDNGFADSMYEHIADDKESLKERIGVHLAEADVIVLSGGVSMGKADYVPEVLADLGVTVRFHGISQRPGRPMWFGTGPEGQAVFALPGNPVSTLVCCRQYVVPALKQMQDEPDALPLFASLIEPVEFPPKLTCFLPVKILSNTGGQLLAMPIRTNTSGDFAALSKTDGYIELPLKESEFPAGTVAPLHRWRA